ncbi:MAG: isocitrate lyase/phosphoenolpyruvate mutase family protein [Pseudomonadota bacterium]
MRNLLSQTQGITAPGVFDALTSLLAEQAGFKAVYLSGASIAYTQLGRPDLGFLSLAQLADIVSRIRQRVETAIIVDADTGFGNALNVVHTVRTLECAGANAIQLEDQQMPKRCGHLAGKTLISCAEMVGKIHAAVDARMSEDTLIIARTDGIAVEGFDHALDRAAQYQAAGADVLFIEAPKTQPQMEQIAAQFSGQIPLLANMVEGGKTPIQSTDELHALGFKLVITPGSLARAMAFAASQLLDTLQSEGSTRGMADKMYTFSQLNDRVGLPDMLALGERYREDAAE